jgi:hypothetical protein
MIPFTVLYDPQWVTLYYVTDRIYRVFEWIEMEVTEMDFDLDELP